jgi:hypothetical protein
VCFVLGAVVLMRWCADVDAAADDNFRNRSKALIQRTSDAIWDYQGIRIKELDALGDVTGPPNRTHGDDHQGTVVELEQLQESYAPVATFLSDTIAAMLIMIFLMMARDPHDLRVRYKRPYMMTVIVSKSPLH